MRMFTPASRVLLLAVLCITSVAHAAQTDPVAKIEEYMQATMKADRFTGAILVARDDKILVSKGYGMADIEDDVPNAPHTKFRLGSITKQFTAAAILLLQERGKLGVQDSVCKYVDDCPAEWQPITIHHLLTHTSGIPNFTAMPDYLKTMALPSPAKETVGRVRALPLEFKPGEKFNYSNSGYVLLGHVIEKVSGQSYEQFVRENIFKPIGMNDTGYDSGRSILKRRASGYTPDGEAFVNAAYLDMTIPHAAGALYSTVGDLYLWDQALNTEKLLTKKSLDALFSADKNEYAYGWGVRQQFNRRNTAHGGGINGFATMISRFPEDKATVIVLSNNEQAPASRIARDLGAIIFGEKYELPAERAVAKVDPKVYDLYVGEYELSSVFKITVTKEDNRLYAQATNQPKLELFPTSETDFFLRVVKADIKFVKNELGQVIGLALFQNGQQAPGKKIK